MYWRAGKQDTQGWIPKKRLKKGKQWWWWWWWRRRCWSWQGTRTHTVVANPHRPPCRPQRRCSYLFPYRALVPCPYRHLDPSSSSSLLTHQAAPPVCCPVLLVFHRHRSQHPSCHLHRFRPSTAPLACCLADPIFLPQCCHLHPSSPPACSLSEQRRSHAQSRAPSPPACCHGAKSQSLSGGADAPRDADPYVASKGHPAGTTIDCAGAAASRVVAEHVKYPS
ncbi:hypothetical protein IWX49DRAFT_365182 [Phyllosticta citricarpa]